MNSTPTPLALVRQTSSALQAELNDQDFDVFGATSHSFVVRALPSNIPVALMTLGDDGKWDKCVLNKKSYRKTLLMLEIFERIVLCYTRRRKL